MQQLCTESIKYLTSIHLSKQSGSFLNTFKKVYCFIAHDESGTKIHSRKSEDKSPFFPFFSSFSIRREGPITPAPATTHPLLLPFTSVCLHSSDKQINILSLLIFTSPIPCNFHKVTSSCLPVRTGRSQAPSL